MQSNSEEKLNNLLLEEQRKEVIAELTKLYIKGVLSFDTILKIREIYTYNLELKYLCFKKEYAEILPKNRISKLIQLNPK